MNLAVLGSVGGVGVEICEPQATKMKQQQLTEKNTFLSFQMVNLDETKSTLTAKETAQMNLTVLGSVGGAGIKICELRQVQRFMKLVHEKYSKIKLHWQNLTVFSMSLMFDGVKDDAPQFGFIKWSGGDVSG